MRASAVPALRIAPSILSADFARLRGEVDRVIASGADVVHVDAMDNRYIPNLADGYHDDMVSAIRRERDAAGARRRAA